MNLPAAWKALWSPTKALAKVRHPGPGGGVYGFAGPGLPPGAKLDYHREGGDLWRNSTVAACLGWLQDNCVTAAPVVERLPPRPGDPAEVIPNHPLIRLYEMPNDHWGKEELLSAWMLSDKVDGNTYFLVGRGLDGAAEPGSLYWVPHWMMEPRWRDPYAFIEWYDYSPGDGGSQRIDPKDVIHIRASPDPYNTRKGCSRLKQGIRSIVGLNRAEGYTAAVVMQGATGGIIMPDGPDDELDDAEGTAIVRRLRMQTTGDFAGSYATVNRPVRIERPNMGPQELAIESLLDRPEATVCALLGVPAMVVGLAVGDATRTFSNLKEAESQGWTNGIMPGQRRFAAAFGRQLLPEFPGFGDPAMLRLRWDYSDVASLQEDAGERATRAVALRSGGIATLNEARDIVGLKPVDGGDDTPVEEAEAALEQEQELMEASAGAAEEEDDEELFKARVGGGKGAKKKQAKVTRSGAPRKPFDENKHVRKEGKFSDKPGAGDDAPRKVRTRVAKAEHTLADRAEREVMAAIGGRHTALKDGKYSPADVEVRRAGGGIDFVEVKARVNGSKPGITMHPDALLRKAELHAATPNSQFHVVAMDLRGQTGQGPYSGHDLYYKRGVGAYAMSKMYKVGSKAELKRLMTMPDADLPALARGSVPAIDDKLRAAAKQAHASRLAKDRRLKARKRQAQADAAAAASVD